MKFGLKFKISVLVALLVLVSVSLLAYWFISRREKAMRVEMRQRAATIAQITGSLGLIQLPGDEKAGWELMRNFVNVVPQLEPMILYIVVVDTEGTVRASRTNTALLEELAAGSSVPELSRRLREEVREHLASAQAGSAAEAVGPSTDLQNRLGHMLTVGVNLMPEGHRLGMIGIGFSWLNIEKQIAQARAISLALTVVLLIVGVGASIGLAGSVTRPIQALVRGMERVRAGDLSAEVQVHSRDEVGLLAQAFNFMTEGLRERERVKSTFKRYVSKDVAEKVLSATDEVSLTGERRRVSVLFADIRGFTSLSETLEPEEVVALLNEHFSRMIEVIFRFEGTLDKFMGDAVMAVFGAPVSHGDDAHRAVGAAVEMEKTLEALNEERKERGARAIQMGIGIATGNVVSGNIGSEQRTEFTVIGDTVNTASRIQGESGGGQILISSETYDEVKDRFKARALERIKVKGKKEALLIYEVLGPV